MATGSGRVRVITEFGMGTSLRRGDYTEAARRALGDALWRNSINAAELLGRAREEMILDVTVAVARPEAVDGVALAAIFPYGTPVIEVVAGGLDIPRPVGDGPPTILAQAAISVRFAEDG